MSLRISPAVLVGFVLLLGSCASCPAGQRAPAPPTQRPDEDVYAFLRRLAPGSLAFCMSGNMYVIGVTRDQARQIQAGCPGVWIVEYPPGSDLESD